MRKYIALGVDETGTKMWNGHFGMSPQFHIYDTNGVFVEARPNPYGYKKGEKHEHHDDPNRIAALLADCKTFLARRMGEKSRQQLISRFPVEAVLTRETLPADALRDYLRGG
jgi:predicted Fe-Mo cluster-binding NifX family protein